jgi:hypothetical protein
MMLRVVLGQISYIGAIKMSRNGILLLLLVVGLFLVAPNPVAAQTVIVGSIEGSVEDATGARLPGVMVTVTSPALQLPQIVKVSDERGEYQFPGLPQGSYRVGFELAGFSKLTREDIVLTAGFTARLDVVLKVGTVDESVTVTGESPLIDLTTTRGGGTLPEATLDLIPNGHTFNDILALTPGLLPKTASQAGQIGFAALASGYNSYGFPGQERNFMDGVNHHSSEGVDFAIAEEVDTKTFGTTAETPTVGAQVSLIVKSGGNDFHGRYREEYFNQNLNSSNVDANLRKQGIGTGDALLFSTDFVGDLGGRIIRDKLWFYTGVRFQRNRRTVTGYSKAPGPDGVFGTADDVPGEPPGRNQETTAKLSWQVSNKHLITGLYNRGSSDDYESFASRFIPREATEDMYYVLHHAKVEWQGTLTNHLLVNVIGASSWYQAQYYDNFIGSPTSPSTLDRTTQIVTGESFDTSGRAALYRTPTIHQADVTVSYSRGAHQLKGGYVAWHHFNTSVAPNLPAGNVQLVFDTVGGLAHQPVQLNVSNRPVNQGTELSYMGTFIQDTWRVSNRLTANMGLRIDRANPFTLPSFKTEGQYGPAAFFPKVDAGTFVKPAPRLGFALDIFGDGKTVAKGSYGRYNWDFGDSFAAVYNLNNQTVTSYRWHDINHDNLYQPGEVNLSTSSGAPDYISVTGSTNPIKNNSFKEPYTHQVSASLERQLTSNLSMRGLYVFWKTVDNYATINPLRPVSAYNIPITVRDPGPDGIANTADDGPPVTIYDYDPAYRGSGFVAQTPANRPAGREDYANSFEGTVTKRGGKFFGETSILFTKNHRWIVGVPQSPNDNFSPIDSTWAITYRVKASYAAPHGIQLSANDFVMSGVPGQRTYLFRGLPQLSTVTVPLETFGAEHGPIRHNLDFRVGKRLSFEKYHLEGAIDLLNALNGNAAWTTNYQSGPAFNYATSIQPPRTARLSVIFDF